MKGNFLLLTLILPAVANLFAQNTGIGILNPVRGKLEVQGVGNTVAIFGGDGQGISIQRSQPAIGFNQYYNGVNSYYIGNGYAAVQWLNTSTGDMYIDLFGSGTANAPYTTITRAITISKDGNVGIGTAPLSYARVAVARGTGSYGTAMFRGSSYASHINYDVAENTYIRGGKAGSYVYLNNGQGTVQMGNPYPTAASLVRVGINSANPFYALEIRQAINRGLVLVAANYANWHLKVGPPLAPGSYQLLYYNEASNPIGSFHPQTCVYAAVSDERLKTDIKPMPDIGPKLEQLQPVQYLVDAPLAKPVTYAGFIAQDVMKVFPALVSQQAEPTPGTAIPDMYMLSYDGMAVYAIKLIQEQQQKIDDLKRRIDALDKTKSK
jgi:Chaperone of endosialidase